MVNPVLGKADFRGRWSAPSKYKGRSVPESMGGSLAVGKYLQRESSPPGVELVSSLSGCVGIDYTPTLPAGSAERCTMFFVGNEEPRV